jgi:hypothetical protein
MKKFVVFWLSGSTSILEGVTITDAFRNAGYGVGVLAGVDFYTEKMIDIDRYKYNGKRHCWEKINASC